MDADRNVIAYGRFTDDSRSLIVVNNNDYEVTRRISVWYIGVPKEAVMKRLIMTTNEGFMRTPEEIVVERGKVNVTLPPFSAVVLHQEEE